MSPWVCTDRVGRGRLERQRAASCLDYRNGAMLLYEQPTESLPGLLFSPALFAGIEQLSQSSDRLVLTHLEVPIARHQDTAEEQHLYTFPQRSRVRILGGCRAHRPANFAFRLRILRI
jgi:hypothetical protein